ncbi:MAG: acyltransferase [Candidatus Nezhaarchaeota archaeon]|nr:acyltransferase [Candidatus Nezhaarchaeota archaeon]
MVALMVGFISRKAVVKTPLVSSTAKIYGASVVCEGSVVDDMVVLGYPKRQGLMNALKQGGAQRTLESLLDEASGGCKVGKGCVLRSGSIIYEATEVSDEVQFGHYVLVREDTKIGSGSLIGSYSVIEGSCSIGSRVNVQSNVFIPRETVIEDGVFLGPNVVITNDRYPPSGRLVCTRICRGAVVSANAIIIAGVSVGADSFVAAGSIVTKDVPEGCAVRGVPARPFSTTREILKKREEYLKEGSCRPPR